MADQFFDRDTTTIVPSLSGLDLNNHDSLVGSVIRLNAGFIAAIAITILVRLWVRMVLLRRAGSDDVLMFVAGCSTIALSAMCIVGTRFGLGRHPWDLDPATVLNQTKRIIQTLFVCQLLYITAVTTTKASIIASYLRILPISGFRLLMYMIATVILSLWVCSVFITIFQCTPVKGAWDFELTNKKCIPIVKFFYVAAAVNIATDLVLCTAPLPFLWKLNIPLNERLMLCLLFGFGGFATAASAVRLSQLHELTSPDVGFACVSSLNWSVVEVGTGIICASIPTTKPLMKRLFPGRFLTIVRGSGRRTRSSVTHENGGDGFQMNTLRASNARPQINLDAKPTASTHVMQVSGRMRESDEQSLVSDGPRDMSEVSFQAL